MFQPNMVPADNNGGGDNNENNNNNNIHGGVNVRCEGFDSGDTSENQEAGLGHNQGPPPQKRKQYHRHTPFQIREMENFFRECPYPDDKQRKQLGRQLGLHHLQIKFWFQNNRTQNKNQLERNENTHLRQENQRLKAENHQCQEAIARATCSRCGGQTAMGNLSFEEHHLRINNYRLTKKIHQLSVMPVRYMSKPGNSSALMSPPIPSPPLEVGIGTVVEDANVYRGDGGNLSRSINGPADDNKPMILELAFGAMEEFLRMAHVGEPLWMGGINGTSLALNLNEYTRIFQNGLGPRLNGYRTEASRDTALVAMGHLSIVETLMNEKRWSTMFPGMIARAITHEEIFPRVPGNFDGALQIMSSELQVVSPLVSTRTSYFVRYCKQQAEGLWAVVDVSIDHLFPNLQLKCRRQPSGCLIKEMQSGYSKVTCIEHVEVDDSEDNHNVFKHLIRTGQAFGANRWLATFDRQCERISSIMASDNPSMEANALTNRGKKSFLKLAERMVKIFLAGMNTSMVTTYQAETGDNIKVMTVMSLNDPGIPNGVVLCTATSFWVPVPPKTIFDFLTDGNNRERWDVLFTKGHVKKVMEIPNGRDCRNNVALFRGADTIQNNMLMIQECSTDPTTSFVIYALVDMSAIENILSGNDSDFVTLLPSGVTIVPDGTAPGGDGGGSLLTVACQMLVETAPSSQLNVSSVANFENLIRLTAHRMMGLFSYQAA